MSKTTKKALFTSLKETFALWIREFSRSLSSTFPQSAPPKPKWWKTQDPNQIGTVLETRETELNATRY